MTAWFLGTIGFGYKQWKGVFYPPAMSPTSYLSHYSRYFNSVEIDSTFYGTPDENKVKRWGASVSADFSISVKTPQQITHESRLNKAQDTMRLFVERMRLLDEKLGVILIQLPPDFSTTDQLTLESFLKSLPTDVRFGVEFRHLSWENQTTAEMLQTYNICWVTADYVVMSKQISRTADFLYLRFLGRHGRYTTKDHERRDPTTELEGWFQQLQPHLPHTKAIFGYFNNDYAGYSPESCNKLKRIVGLKTAVPQIPKQGRLF